jgi:hypothetical protein
VHYNLRPVVWVLRGRVYCVTRWRLQNLVTYILDGR